MNIADSYWESSAPLHLFHTNGEPITVIENVVLQDTAQIKANNDQFTARNITYQ